MRRSVFFPQPEKAADAYKSLKINFGSFSESKPYVAKKLPTGGSQDDKSDGAEAVTDTTKQKKLPTKKFSLV